MADIWPGSVTIRTQIRREFSFQTVNLAFAIGADQAKELLFGPPPPYELRCETQAWEARQERARALAEHIAKEIAYGIVAALNPPDKNGP